MMNFLRKHMRTIFLITIVGFLAGAFIGFGSYLFGGKTAFDAVLEVNGTEIPYRQFTTIVNRTLDNMRQQKQEVNDETIARLKQEVIQDLIQEEVFWQEAKKYGIAVSDGELAADIQRYPAFQQDGKFSHSAYYQMLAQVMRTTPKEFETSRRRQIAIAKLRQTVSQGVVITEPELVQEYARTHKGSIAGLEKDREKFLEGLRREKTMLVFNEWFKDLNRTLKVKVHLAEIERAPAPSTNLPDSGF